MPANEMQKKLIADAMSVIEKLTPWEQDFIRHMHDLADAGFNISDGRNSVINKINNKVVRLKDNLAQEKAIRARRETIHDIVEGKLKEVEGTGDME